MTVLPLKEYEATDIKKIRNDIGATQVVFASIMGVSKKTVEAWEAGRMDLPADCLQWCRKIQRFWINTAGDIDAALSIGEQVYRIDPYEVRR